MSQSYASNSKSKTISTAVQNELILWTFSTSASLQLYTSMEGTPTCRHLSSHRNSM